MTLRKIEAATFIFQTIIENGMMQLSKNVPKPYSMQNFKTKLALCQIFTKLMGVKRPEVTIRFVLFHFLALSFSLWNPNHIWLCYIDWIPWNIVNKSQYDHEWSSSSFVQREITQHCRKKSAHGQVPFFAYPSCKNTGQTTCAWICSDVTNKMHTLQNNLNLK